MSMIIINSVKYKTSHASWAESSKQKSNNETPLLSWGGVLLVQHFCSFFLTNANVYDDGFWNNCHTEK